MTWWIQTVLPASFLTIAVIDDILFRKFHNFLFVGFTFLAFVALVLNSNATFLSGFLGFCTGFAVFLPFVALGITGAGDMKFMMAFGVLVGPETVLWVTAYGIMWGAIIGAFKILVSGNLFASLIHIYNLSLKPKAVAQSTKIPFTVALMMGWFSWTLSGGFL